MDAAEEVKDLADDPGGGVTDMVTDDVTGAAVTDTRFTAGTVDTVAHDPTGGLSDMADSATGGGAGNAADTAGTANDLKDLSQDDD